MARLLLIRHAPTPETGTRLTGRQPGVSLDDAGYEIARATAGRLADVSLKAVYASPLERTWETATEIADPHGLEPIRHDGLMEVDYGSWSGRTLKSLSRLKAWQAVQNHPSRVRFPDGESIRTAQLRAVEACEEISQQHRRQTVAAVSHADVIKAALSHYLGQPLDLFQRIFVSPGSVSVVDLSNAHPPRVLAINTNGDPSAWQ